MTEPYHRQPTPDLVQLRRIVGGYLWWETRLFETLGAWARDETDPGVRRMFATQCHHRAWHAELWAGRLPAVELADTAPPAAADLVIDALRSASTTIERLAGVHRAVVPRLAVAYTAHRRVSDPLIDEPTCRVLDLVLRDEAEHWHDGEAALQRLVVSPTDVAAAAAHQQLVETALLAVGPEPFRVS